jgi:hypothetical protein
MRLHDTSGTVVSRLRHLRAPSLPPTVPDMLANLRKSLADMIEASRLDGERLSHERSEFVDIGPRNTLTFVNKLAPLDVESRGSFTRRFWIGIAEHL